MKRSEEIADAIIAFAQRAEVPHGIAAEVCRELERHSNELGEIMRNMRPAAAGDIARAIHNDYVVSVASAITTCVESLDTALFRAALAARELKRLQTQPVMIPRPRPAIVPDD